MLRGIIIYIEGFVYALIKLPRFELVLIKLFGNPANNSSAVECINRNPEALIKYLTSEALVQMDDEDAGVLLFTGSFLGLFGDLSIFLFVFFSTFTEASLDDDSNFADFFPGFSVLFPVSAVFSTLTVVF